MVIWNAFDELNTLSVLFFPVLKQNTKTLFLVPETHLKNIVIYNTSILYNILQDFNIVKATEITCSTLMFDYCYNYRNVILKMLINT